MAIDYKITRLLTIKFFTMKSLSMKKFSLLGLLLVSASAIIAAVLPAKENKDTLVGNGSLRDT